MGDNEFVGKECYVQWVTGSGTVELYTDARNFSYTPSIEYIDRTAGADASRKRLTSFKDGNATLEMLAQSDGTAILALCAEGTHGTLTWGPAGTATGKPKRYCAAYAGGVQEANPYNDVATWTITWQQDGDRTDTVWGA